jgi:hypothetical protein
MMVRGESGTRRRPAPDPTNGREARLNQARPGAREYRAMAWDAASGAVAHEPGSSGHNGTQAMSAAGGSARDEPASLQVEAAQLSDVVQRASALAAELRQIEERAAERAPNTPIIDATRQRLMHAAETGVDVARLAELEELLSAWGQRPNDLLVMVKLSEQAGLLAAAVRTLRELYADAESH